MFDENMKKQYAELHASDDLRRRIMNDCKSEDRHPSFAWAYGLATAVLVVGISFLSLRGLTVTTSPFQPDSQVSELKEIDEYVLAVEIDGILGTSVEVSDGCIATDPDEVSFETELEVPAHATIYWTIPDNQSKTYTMNIKGFANSETVILSYDNEFNTWTTTRK